jgi:pSer/pThr/pTyr-binding forkhead associated (FHA) protein
MKSWTDGKEAELDESEVTTMNTMLTLRALTGDLRGQEFQFSGPASCVLGRSRSCQLRLPGDATVSRQHCLIELEGKGVWVQDLGSLNGTHVNGEKIGQRERERQTDATMIAPPRQELNDGDELRVCNNIFAVVLAEIEAPSPTTPVVPPSVGSSSSWPMPVFCI